MRDGRHIQRFWSELNWACWDDTEEVKSDGTQDVRAIPVLELTSETPVGVTLKAHVINVFKRVGEFTLPASGHGFQEPEPHAT